MTVNISLEKLMDTGAHYGHQTRRWNPKMEEYLYTSENGVHIFDLVKTKEALEEALDFLEKASKEGKKIVFVGTKKQAKETAMVCAKEAGCFYVNERWLGGTLTNFEQIKRSLKKLDDLREDKKTGALNKFTKKERLLIDREIERLGRFFGGLQGLDKAPEVLIIVDVKKEKGACLEAKGKEIQVIGIVDSNSDPDLVDFPIPMNDDATHALEYVLELMKEAIIKGASSVKEDKVEGKKVG